MNETKASIEKNGKGYVIRISTFGAIVSIIVGMIAIIGFAFMPYKAFTDFANESRRDREAIRVKASTADSIATLGMKYSIENNYNMKLYFELGQPKSFKWTTYPEIKRRIYLDGFDYQ